MSVQYMREALLTRDKHAALVKQALRCLPPAQALTITRPRPSTPGPALTAMSRRPPSSDTHLPLLLDSYQTWWYLDESLEAPPARETPPSPQDGPSPAQLAYVLLKLREEVCTRIHIRLHVLSCSVPDHHPTTTCNILMFCTRPPPHYHMQYPRVMYQTTTPLPHAISL